MNINKPKNSTYIIKGNDESIEKIFKAADLIGKIKDIKIKKLKNNGCDILSNLTINEKKILHSAKELGYYDYPRKITHEELSEKIGIKKDIVLENLRKAEKRIITKIFNDD
jgi:predicted DNA binding protein